MVPGVGWGAPQPRGQSLAGLGVLSAPETVPGVGCRGLSPRHVVPGTAGGPQPWGWSLSASCGTRSLRWGQGRGTQVTGKEPPADRAEPGRRAPPTHPPLGILPGPCGSQARGARPLHPLPSWHLSGWAPSGTRGGVHTHCVQRPGRAVAAAPGCAQGPGAALMWGRSGEATAQSSRTEGAASRLRPGLRPILKRPLWSPVGWWPELCCWNEA